MSRGVKKVLRKISTPFRSSAASGRHQRAVRANGGSRHARSFIAVNSLREPPGRPRARDSLGSRGRACAPRQSRAPCHALGPPCPTAQFGFRVAIEVRLHLRGLNVRRSAPASCCRRPATNGCPTAFWCRRCNRSTRARTCRGLCASTASRDRRASQYSSQPVFRRRGPSWSQT